MPNLDVDRFVRACVTTTRHRRESIRCVIAEHADDSTMKTGRCDTSARIPLRHNSRPTGDVDVSVILGTVSDLDHEPRAGRSRTPPHGSLTRAGYNESPASILSSRGSITYEHSTARGKSFLPMRFANLATLDLLRCCLCHGGWRCWLRVERVRKWLPRSHPRSR